MLENLMNYEALQKREKLTKKLEEESEKEV
jgi:hypothetical protein